MIARKILVVDDEPEIASATLFLLRSEGYAADYAPDGEAAVQAVLQNQVSLVVTDYMMPIMDGQELVQALRLREETASLPVVVSSVLPEEVVRAKIEQFDAFIRKPFKAHQLLQTVRQILGPP